MEKTEKGTGRGDVNKVRVGVELPCEFYEVVRVAYQSKNFVHSEGLESQKETYARRVVSNSIFN